MKKKFLSLLLVLCFVMAFGSITALAAEGQTTDIWDGTADTSWYTGHETESEYHITTAEQLAGLAQLINTGTITFEGKTVYLDNDLDLDKREWISIGKGKGGNQAAYSFCGIFDGQGHVISNLYSRDSLMPKTNVGDDKENCYRQGLFGNVYDGEVKNLGIENADIIVDLNDASTYGKGILVDWLCNSKITNCWTSGSISGGAYLEHYVGGIAGCTLRNSTLAGCYSTATITGNYKGTYYEEENENVMTYFDCLGGIAGGMLDGSLTVEDCWFSGKINVNSVQATVGGIVGYSDNASVTNCMVTSADLAADKGGNTCWVVYSGLSLGTAENNYWPADDRYQATLLKEQDGTAVSDFTSADVLSGLQAKQGADIEWVAGIDHPTFAWDDRNIPADYTAVDAAIAKADKIDGTLYSNYEDVKAAINAVDRKKSKYEQKIVDAMAKSIEDAVAGLKEKDNGKDNNKDNNTPVTPQIKTYTVTFKAAGGSAVKAQKVEEGKSVSKPKNPTRKGYKFAGWYTGKTAYKFDTPVKKNLTLTAKWTKIKVKKIKIAGMSKQIAAGKKIKLKVTVTPKTAANRTVKWKSSNKKYATVNSKGVVTVKKAGIGKKVTITATAKDGSGKKATYRIKIMKKAVKKITLKASKTKVTAGKKVTIKATVTPGKDVYKKLTYKSSNKKYATVNSKGVVTTKKAGKGKTVKIIATATDGSGKKATIKIKIK